MFPRIAAATLATFLTVPSLEARAQDAPADLYLGLGAPVEWRIDGLQGKYTYYDRQDRKWSVSLTTREKTAEGTPKFITLTAATEGVAPASVSIDIDSAAQFGSLAVYDFDPELPTFLITNYTMGAHCCTVGQALSFDGGKLNPVDVGAFDGSEIPARDIDGDGTQEIETWDQRFYYAFDSYAGSLPARRILKIRATVDDVTDQPSFQNYLLSEVNRMLPDCLNNPGPGLCAGVLGTAAKAGVYQSIAADVNFKQIDDANKQADYLDCSAEQCGVEMRFWNFREALEFQFEQWGYRTESSLTDKARTFFTRLAALPKGFGTNEADNEFACDSGAVRIRLDKSAQTAEMLGYEYSCRIEKASVLVNSAVALGMCRGDGGAYAATLFLELQDDTLHMGSIVDNTVISAEQTTALKACP